MLLKCDGITVVHYVHQILNRCNCMMSAPRVFKCNNNMITMRVKVKTCQVKR